MLGDVFDEFLVERMMRQCGGVAQYNQLHAGTRNGYIHAAKVVQKTDSTLIVASHHRNQDNITFLTLEAIDRIDRNLAYEWLEETALLYEFAEQLHLALVGRDDAEVDAVVQDAFDAHLTNIVAQGLHQKQSLARIDAALAEWRLLLLETQQGGIDPHQGGIEFQYATSGNLGSGLKLALIEPVGRELHDVLVHAVLRGEQFDAFGFPLGNRLHQCLVQSLALRFDTLDGRGELTMVARQDDAVGLEDGCPTSGFQGLCGFVDEEGREMTSLQDTRGGAYQRAGNDAALGKEFFVEAYLQFRLARP